MRVELIYDEECPNAAVARANLGRAFAAIGLPARWAEREVSARSSPPQRGYGSPTVLVNGRDVAGAEPGNAASCRVYEVNGRRTGAPPAELIARALVLARKREAAMRRGRGLVAVVTGAIVLVSLVASPASWSLAAQSSATSHAASTVSIPVVGMTCASCSAHVRKALLAIEGVTDAQVSLKHRSARVRYLSDKLKPEDLVAAINRLGYKAGPPTIEDSVR